MLAMFPGSVPLELPGAGVDCLALLPEHCLQYIIHQINQIHMTQILNFGDIFWVFIFLQYLAAVAVAELGVNPQPPPPLHRKSAIFTPKSHQKWR